MKRYEKIETMLEDISPEMADSYKARYSNWRSLAIDWLLLKWTIVKCEFFKRFNNKGSSQ